MNYWYTPLLESQYTTASQLPSELLSAVTAPCRTTAELEAVRAKAKALAHYDLAGAAHDALLSRKQQQAEEAKRALRKGHRHQKQEHDHAATDTVAAVEAMWALQLDQLRSQAAAAVMDLQDKHEDALQKLRLKQADRVYHPGIRPQHRSTELLNLRRSEAVLASKYDFAAASKIKSRADQVAAEEASQAHMDWLLHCHAQEERLLAQQRREMEALHKRWDGRLRDVEATRDRDLAQLGRKIKVGSTIQRRDFTKERKNVESALRGCMLNTQTTRAGKGLEAAFPTMALLAASQPVITTTTAAAALTERPSTEPSAAFLGALRSPSGSSQPNSPSSQNGSWYLGPGSSGRDAAAARLFGAKESDTAAAQGVRFVATPRREAWAAPNDVNEAARPQTPPEQAQAPGTSSRPQTPPVPSAPGSSSRPQTPPVPPLGSRPQTPAPGSSSRPQTPPLQPPGSSTRPQTPQPPGFPSRPQTPQPPGPSSRPHTPAPQGLGPSSRPQTPSQAPASSNRPAAPGSVAGAPGGGNTQPAQRAQGLFLTPAVAPSSAAVASGTTGGATGSGNSALTEAAVRAINQAAGTPAKAAAPAAANGSMQSSSFKSNKPYAGNLPARAVARPATPNVLKRRE